MKLRIEAQQFVYAARAEDKATGGHKGPVYYEELGNSAEKDGEFYVAAQWFYIASGVCLGHGRAERLDDASARCERLAEEWLKKQLALIPA